MCSYWQWHVQLVVGHDGSVADADETMSTGQSSPRTSLWALSTHQLSLQVPLALRDMDWTAGLVSRWTAKVSLSSWQWCREGGCLTPKMSLSPHCETYWRWIVRNFQNWSFLQSKSVNCFNFWGTFFLRLLTGTALITTRPLGLGLSSPRSPELWSPKRKFLVLPLAARSAVCALMHWIHCRVEFHFASLLERAQCRMSDCDVK